MPPFARCLSAMGILLAAGWQASFADDRYADRYADNRYAEDRYAEDRNVDRFADDRFANQAAPGDAAAPANTFDPLERTEEYESHDDAVDASGNWPPSVKPIKKQLIKFEKQSAKRPRSQVVAASAVEPVASDDAPAKLAKPRLLKPEQAAAPSKRSSSGPLPSLPTLLGSVGVVVGLFLIIAWLTKRGMPKQAPLLPRDALEVLGRQRFGGKQELQLVRLGNKLVLIHVSPGHVESIAEVTDPEEVDRLTGLCYQNKPTSSSRGFQQTLDQFAKEKPIKRAVGRSVVDKLDISMFEGLGRSSSKTA